MSLVIKTYLGWLVILPHVCYSCEKKVGLNVVEEMVLFTPDSYDLVGSFMRGKKISLKSAKNVFGS